MRYLLNTNHAVALLNDDPRIAARLAQPEYSRSDLGITTIALGELYYGAFHVERERVEGRNDGISDASNVVFSTTVVEDWLAD